VGKPPNHRLLPKLLGVIFDQELRWKEHVQQAIKRATKVAIALAGILYAIDLPIIVNCLHTTMILYILLWGPKLIWHCIVEWLVSWFSVSSRWIVMDMIISSHRAPSSFVSCLGLVAQSGLLIPDRTRLSSHVYLSAAFYKSPWLTALASNRESK